MPELPEVEAARRRLDRWVTGRKVVAVHLLDPASVRSSLSSRPRDARPDAAAAIASWVGGVAEPPVRRGKRLGWGLGRSGLLAHFGMSGKWVLRATDVPPPKFARVGLAFEGDRVCWFADARRFGCVTVVAGGDLADAVVDGLGPDALEACPTGPQLAERFRVRRPIKVALLEQDRLAGLGNIHAAEALWRAGIHPDRPANELTPADWKALSEGIRAQMSGSVADFDGDGDVTYVSEGATDNRFAVYGQTERACPRCGGAVSHAQLGGRTTWWCATCQPARDGSRGVG
jgi:formamidopyrimidine-DNA glycosylase